MPSQLRNRLTIEEQIEFIQKEFDNSHCASFLDVLTSLRDLRNVKQVDIEEEKPEVLKKSDYFIGQRVLLNGSEIGTVAKAENSMGEFDESKIWVFSPSRGYPSCYSVHNVKPLPNGQV